MSSELLLNRYTLQQNRTKETTTMVPPITENGRIKTLKTNSSCSAEEENENNLSLFFLATKTTFCLDYHLTRLTNYISLDRIYKCFKTKLAHLYVRLVEAKMIYMSSSKIKTLHYCCVVDARGNLLSTKEV